MQNTQIHPSKIDEINNLVNQLTQNNILIGSAITLAQASFKEYINEEVEVFLRNELNGYEELDLLPKYRYVGYYSYGIFRNTINGIERQMDLPFAEMLLKSGLENHDAHSKPINISILEIQSILDSHDDFIELEFTPEQLSFARKFLSHDAKNGWKLTHANFKIHRSNLSKILSYVSSKLISHLLGIKNSLEQSQLPESSLFLQGEKFESAIRIRDIIKSAERNIIIIDNYVNEDTLKLISDIDDEIEIIIVTDPRCNNESFKHLVELFNLKNQKLTIKTTKSAHDRFIIIDNQTFYHLGASLKDAGNKIFMINLVSNDDHLARLLNDLNLN